MGRKSEGKEGEEARKKVDRVRVKGVGVGRDRK